MKINKRIRVCVKLDKENIYKYIYIYLFFIN